MKTIYNYVQRMHNLFLKEQNMEFYIYGCGFLDNNNKPINFIFKFLTVNVWIDIKNDATLQFLDQRWIITQNQVTLFTTDDFFSIWSSTNAIPGLAEGANIDGRLSQFNDC
jgi:hypothetical protein